ncbi:hypothetical protein HG537_0D03190 [Torulaspora globosa]|uniref:3'(2'),5'-bisphosphate nucleotidase n=1 Tax=Torulaspora globosa TaxID=48254 RepID=A0A7H9HRE1_9SACH|nr:hypothetical protein HG537_0D03190 [Torulaspora sp. CBS 2947]
MGYEKELFVATQAVLKASFLTKRIQSKVIAHRDTSTITKSDQSPVTIGDYAAQSIIINAIKANFPDDKIVGEESSQGLEDVFVSEILNEIRENDQVFESEFAGQQASKVLTNEKFPLKTIQDVKTVIDFGDYEGGDKGRVWCLDPIDGTKGFLRGEQFAVCLALIVDGTTQLGVIGCPNLSLNQYGGEDSPSYDRFGYVFRAARRQGTWFAPAAALTTEPETHWTKIHARKLSSTTEMVSLEGAEKSHSSHEEQSIIKNKLGISKSLHLDSQVKYCMLALGLGDVYLRLPIKMDYQEKIWDHAAGNVIVEEAGGVHTDSLENVPLNFGQGRTLHTKGVIASSGPQELHDLILRTSGKVLKSRNN